MRPLRLVAVLVLALLAGRSFADATVPESFWRSPLWIRDGVSDFGGKSVGAFFRDVTFQEVVLAQGDVIGFSIACKSVSGSDVILQFSMLRNKVVTERFDFHFRFGAGGTLLYRLSSDRGTVQGYDEMRRAVRLFYLPTISEYAQP